MLKLRTNGKIIIQNPGFMTRYKWKNRRSIIKYENYKKRKDSSKEIEFPVLTK